MKKFVSDFILRGLLAAAGGPVVLAIVYGILGQAGIVDTLTPAEVCKGILTVTLLALTVGGMTAIYQVERLPLVSAILIHCGVLYMVYILIYLINGWLKNQLVPIAIFTAAFILGYALIWLCVYLSIRAKTEALNRKFRKEAT